ncbi:MAG: TIGR03084 family protein [Rhodobacteraceae bacterium]|nr:TIGR03084 family protein [Paracoccaceae bacterium]
MQQVKDFQEECEALAKAVDGLNDDGFKQPTLFKGWTIGDVLVHLHFWNKAAQLTLFEPKEFQTLIKEVFASFEGTGLRAFENNGVKQRGESLRDEWKTLFRQIGRDWIAVDPKKRLSWAGPDMSVRSAITARQMETWAHGQGVFDALGKTRVETDRIRNVVFLGVNTFAWSFKVHGRPIPAQMPFLDLAAPSGDRWVFGEENTANRIEGEAVEFAQVVTQTRNIADTELVVTGPVSHSWMTNAQCFAGPPETPPEPGARFCSQ